MDGIGLHNEIISLLDKDLAYKRILRDIQSDFIFAPHFNDIYQYAQDELFERLISKLKSGNYNPRLPITINVIKQNGFSRPGSILEPLDRLTYQLIIDYIAPFGEKDIDRVQVFSNKLLDSDPNGFMFEKPHISYKEFQLRIETLCNNSNYHFVLNADIASYFERIYQHVICNMLNSTGVDTKAVTFLEKLLSKFTQSDSHGILQGIFPSDFLGNFSLCTIDAQHSLSGIEYARYVDDFYVFFNELNDAKIHKIILGNLLSKDGLSLNESKTKIYKTEDLLKEETEIDRLFESAKDEIYEEIYAKKEEKNESAWSYYGSTLSWNIDDDDIEDSEIDEEEIEMRAVENLFDFDTNSKTRIKIEKFCLPLFSAYKNNYALTKVIQRFSIEPSMSQIYFTYLINMIRIDETTISLVENILNDKNLIFDYQKLWLYSILLFSKKLSNNTINKAVNVLQNINNHFALRGICAILIGKHGNAAQRRILKNHYSTEFSEYVRSAILYASQYFPNQERDTCFRAWAGHNETNSLIVTAIKNKK